MTTPEAIPGRAGAVALIGWTNVGKSTLLNRLVGDKLAAVSGAAQTTRHRITGVRHLPGGSQIAFIDTPGLHRPRSRLNRAMVQLVHRTVGAADLAALVVDAARGPGPGDVAAAALLGGVGQRLVVLNKVDLVRPKSRLLPMMRVAVEEWGFAEAVPVSAATGEGCDELLARLLARLPAGPPAYPEDFLTDQTERALAAEWIREELLARTRDELPHSLAVLIDSWQERGDGGPLQIHASILVDRPSQKAIVIGRGGALLEQAGRAARVEIERLFAREVELRLWVKVRRNWRNDERMLRQLGVADG